MNKTDYIVQSRLTDKGDYDVQVEIRSSETEEAAILLAGIKTLIGMMEISVEGDTEKYKQAMRKIMGYVADDIGFTTGYYAEELHAEISLDKSYEPYVSESVQMELIKNYFE